MHLKFGNNQPTEITSSSMHEMELLIAVKYTNKKFGKWMFWTRQLDNDICFRAPNVVKYTLEDGTSFIVTFVNKLDELKKYE